MTLGTAIVVAQGMCVASFVLGLYIGLALMKFAYENN